MFKMVPARFNPIEIFKALGDYFSDLFSGDPVALTMTGIILVPFLLFCLYWWKVARDLRREDEERQRKRGGGPKKDAKR